MELNKKLRLSKILLTLGALEFFGPILRDTNSSHLLNPEWVGHARFHLMWCISLWGSMGIFSLILLWKNPQKDSKPLYMVLAMQLLNSIAFWSSTLLSGLYDGDIFDAKIHVGIMNINENIVVFTVLTLFLFFNYWYVKVKIDPLIKEREKDSALPVLEKTKVLISGGGPSGMIAAIYLSQQGIPNILIERRKEIQKHPKAHELSSRSIEILTSLGIPIEKLMKEASDQETASRILFCNTINEEIGRIDLSDKNIKEKYDRHLASSIPYLNISQTEFEKILREHLTEQKLTTILVGHQWISSKEGDKIQSVVLDKESKQKFLIESDYLIFADGARSEGRSQLGIKMKGPEKIQDVVNAYFTNDLSKYVKTKAKLYWIFQPQAPGVFIAHHPEKRWVYHHTIETPFQKIENFDEAYFQEKLRIATGLGNDFHFNIESISSWRMTAQIAERFRSGNTFLIGDAAHRFPPTGGLGMNSGIGDAQNLCWKIAAVVKGHAQSSLLDTYETERMPILQKNCEESKNNWFRILEVPRALGLNPFLGKMMSILLNSFLLSWIPTKKRWELENRLRKSAGISLLKNLENPHIIAKTKNAISNQTSHFDRLGLDIGYRYLSSANRPSDKDTNVSEYTPSTEEGNRFPHFWLDQEKKISSHTLLSATNFTVILFETSKWKATWQRLKTESQKHFPFDLKTIRIHSEHDAPSLEGILSIGLSGAILVRPDGHIAGKIWDAPDEKHLEKMFLQMTNQISNPILSNQPSGIQKTNTMGFNKMIVFSLLVFTPILLLLFFLFRPLEHKPQPANFHSMNLEEGKFENFNPKPNHIFGMGLVYSKHIIETAASFDPAVPPPIFLKEQRSLNQKQEDVVLPDEQELKNAIQSFEPALKQNENLDQISLKALLDYEVELAFVLLEDIKKEDLEDTNFAPKLGFFIANDLSARSLAVFGEGLENRVEYWGVSKSFPGFLPISSKIWIPNIHYPNGLPNVTLESYVNQELRQKESALNMIYTPKEMLRFIQNKYKDISLKKGDIVITGTPGGVALSTPKSIARLFDLMHFDRFTKLKLLLKKDDTRFLKTGDEVIVKGTGLGEVKTRITQK